MKQAGQVRTQTGELGGQKCDARNNNQEMLSLVIITVL